MEVVTGFVLIIGLLLLWAVVTGKIKSAKFKGPEGLGGLELEAPGSDPPPPAPDVTHHHYGISLKEHEESLKRREQEIREEIKEAQEKDQEKIQILEMQLNALDQKLSNPEKDLEDHKKLLAKTEQALEQQSGLEPEELEQAKVALKKGDTDKAEELFEKVLKTEEKSIEHSAEASYILGRLAQDRVDYEVAWKALTRAADLAPDNSQYLNEAGMMAHTLARYDEAIGYYEKALDLDLKAHGPEHPNLAAYWNNLGDAWRNIGEYNKSIEFYERALASDLKTFGPEHPNVAIYWNNLGAVWQVKGEDDKAIEYIEKALASDLKNFGSDHPQVASIWNNLGGAWQNKGDTSKAREYFNMALEVFQKAGLEHRVRLVEGNIRTLPPDK